MARVLLIEDDAALRSFLEHVLFDAHYQVDLPLLSRGPWN